jgi:cytidine deaminase
MGSLDPNVPKKTNIISYGNNHYVPSRTDSIHAEHCCINKLPYSRKPIKINILVVRFTKNGQLSNSKPCSKCVKMMLDYFPKKGYIVKKIWYSNEYGKISKSSLNKLRYSEI